MLVLATAGHVDHGKSTLLRALTGMEPDRWAEERRRGMTLDLGFVWGLLPGGATFAAVDVPGHERFVPTMLAGAGPVPAALLVVAADGGWMPQTEEHMAALVALGVRHGVVAVTRSDLADPAPVVTATAARLVGTGLSAAAVVAVSAIDGGGLPSLRTALADLAAGLPVPDPAQPVRLWVDRAFTMRGAGTVVTGTLGAGTIRVGDALDVTEGRSVRVRGVQSLGRPVADVAGPARVALNLRGVTPGDVPRGTALRTPAAWRDTVVVDVRVDGPAAALPRGPVLHVGSAAVAVRVRGLDSVHVRLRLDRALPLRVGDRVLLRDPGSRALVGADVLDPMPPELRRRGAAAARSEALGTGTAAGLRARRVSRAADLAAMGIAVPSDALAVGGWVLDPAYVEDLRRRLPGFVSEHRAARPLEAGPSAAAVAHRLGLPDPGLVPALAAPPLAVRDGRLVDESVDEPPAELAEAVAGLGTLLADTPFAAPDAAGLATLGLTRARVAAARRLGLVTVPAEGIVLLPDAVDRAVEVLDGLPAPFTVGAAARALGTSRRVAVPLLEHLDRLGHTVRVDGTGRRLRNHTS